MYPIIDRFNSEVKASSEVAKIVKSSLFSNQEFRTLLIFGIMILALYKL